jgi:hypothetical protein
MYKTLPRYIYLLLFLLCAFLSNPLSAQRKKTPSITDEIGILAGINIMPFYPKDVNRHPIHGGDPKVLPSGFFGLAYYHDYKGPFVYVFQLELSDHQLKYWRTTRQNWSLDHQPVIVKSDSGDYHIKYRDLSMKYMLGYCLNKKAGWHVYGGIQVNFTIANFSTKTVDRVEYGELKGFNFIPYPQPLYIYNETSITYAPDSGGEILFRTDVRLKMGEHFTLRPVLEYGFNTGHVQESVKNRAAFYFQLTRKI